MTHESFLALAVLSTLAIFTIVFVVAVGAMLVYDIKRGERHVRDLERMNRERKGL